MWAKIITIKRSKDLNYFNLCVLNLFNTQVSQFEFNYWNKLTFPRHSNLLRCTCMQTKIIIINLCSVMQYIYSLQHIYILSSLMHQTRLSSLEHLVRSCAAFFEHEKWCNKFCYVVGHMICFINHNHNTFLNVWYTLIEILPSHRYIHVYIQISHRCINVFLLWKIKTRGKNNCMLCINFKINNREDMMVFFIQLFLFVPYIEIRCSAWF